MATWKQIIATNPAHSENYANRWRAIAASGKDIYGEARLVDALVERESRILDAGCGTGRLGGWLASRGHRVTGHDVDPILIRYAEQDYPDADWHVRDLGVDDPDPDEAYDAIVCAGNVVTFLTPEELRHALGYLAAVTVPGGRVVVGFGAGRGLDFGDFVAEAETAGLRLDYRFATWDLKPFDEEESDFLVALFTRP